MCSILYVILNLQRIMRARIEQSHECRHGGWTYSHFSCEPQMQSRSYIRNTNWLRPQSHTVASIVTRRQSKLYLSGGCDSKSIGTCSTSCPRVKPIRKADFTTFHFRRFTANAVRKHEDTNQPAPTLPAFSMAGKVCPK